MTDEPEFLLARGHRRATQLSSLHGQTHNLYHAARKQLVLDLVETYGATLQKAQNTAKASDPAGAAELCKALYTSLVNHLEEDERAKLRDILSELAWLVAVYSCAVTPKPLYDAAAEYLSKEDCSRFPTHYYISLLARTRGGTAGFGDTEYLSRAYFEDINRAIREGLPGAEQVKKKLGETLMKALDIAIANEKYALAQMEAEEAFEAAHGISREEYEARQAALRREEAQARRDRQLRDEFEWAERDWDLMTGGTGKSAEEKLLLGEASFFNYSNYNALKEAYIKRKTS